MRSLSSTLYSLSVALVLLTFAAAPAAEPNEEAVLSDDGEVVTVAKVPNALRLADFSNHLGLVPAGTRVRVLGTQRDPAIPATWTKVEILEGEYRGETGWALSQTVVVRKTRPPVNSLPGSEDNAGGEKTGEGAGNEARARKVVTGTSPQAALTAQEQNDQAAPVGSTHRVVEATAMFSNASVFDPTGKRVAIGDWVERIDEKAKDDNPTSFRWIRVVVRSGQQEEQTGWLPSHTLKERRFISVIIANKSRESDWELASNLARHRDVILYTSHDFDAQQEPKDLSMADEVVVIEHSLGGETFKGETGYGDSPRSLAEKLRAAKIRSNASVELLICNAGSEIKFDDDKFGTFAGRMAAELKMPVFAYSHYVRIVTKGCLDEEGCSGAWILGYRYKIDPFTDKPEVDPLTNDEKRPVDTERIKFMPTGKGTTVGGEPAVISKNNRRKLDRPKFEFE